jgi:hypothetical protein
MERNRKVYAIELYILVLLLPTSMYDYIELLAYILAGIVNCLHAVRENVE